MTSIMSRCVDDIKDFYYEMGINNELQRLEMNLRIFYQNTVQKRVLIVSKSIKKNLILSNS